MSPKNVLVELAPPNKVNVHKDAEKTIITFDWFNTNHWSSAINGVVFGIFTFLFPHLSANTENVSVSIFTAIWFLLTCLFIYHTLAGFFNRTTATVTNQSLTVTYGPLSWPRRDRFHQFSEIDTVFVKRDKTAATWRHNYPPIFYAVYVMSDGKTTPVFRYLGSELTASYLCTEIQAARGQAVKPFWQPLLDQLNENNAHTPLFGAEKPLLYRANQIGDVVQALFQHQYQGRLAVVTNEQRTQFDVLHFDYGEGKLYHLTRVVLRQYENATNVIVTRKSVPHLAMKWVSQRDVNGLLRDIEAQLERNRLSGV